MSDLLDLARAVGVTDDRRNIEWENILSGATLGLLFIIIVWMWFACPIH